MKKVIIIVVAILLLGGGGVGGYFYYKSKKDSNTNAEKAKTETTKKWNPYATEDYYQKTLNDFLISAVNGDFVVKMTVTLDLKDKEAQEKFEGLAKAPTAKEEKASASSHESSSSESTTKVLTPMETQINSLIGNFMLEQTEDSIHDKKSLEVKLKDYLNKNLNVEENFITKVYVDNYIIQ